MTETIFEENLLDVYFNFVTSDNIEEVGLITYSGARH